MVRFIDERPASTRIELVTACGTLLIVIVTAALFIREVIPTVGFLALTGVGMAGLFLLDERIKKRYRTVVEIIPGKPSRQPSGKGKYGTQVFHEDARHLAVLLAAFAVCLLPAITQAIRAGDPIVVGISLLGVVPVLFMLAALSLSLARVSIDGDHIQVTNPCLGPWRNRRFHFREIASVEIRNLRRAGTEVLIRLLDGGKLSYMTWNPAVASELLEALKLGVAEAKLSPPDCDELA